MNTHAPIWAQQFRPAVDPFFQPEKICLNGMLKRAFDQWADMCQFEYYGQTYTYAEMRQLAAQVASALKAAGIKRGDRVALHLPNTPWHPIFFFGVMAAGGVVTHLSPLDAEAEIAHKVHDVGAKMVISLSTPEFAERFTKLVQDPDFPPIYLCDDPISAMGRPCPVPESMQSASALLAGHEGAVYDPPMMRLDELALLQFTGGTTGVPKAAMLTHGNLSAAEQTYNHLSAADPGAEPGKPGMLYAPLFHIMGLTSAMLKRTMEGGRMHLRLRFDAASVIDDVEKHRIASLSGVPTTWIAIMQLPDIDKRDLSSVENVSSGGAPLPREVFNRIRDLTGLKIGGGWGMTETASNGTSVPRDFPDEKLGTIGIPLPGMDMAIVDLEDPTKRLATGEPGEIIIKGPAVTIGYWQNEEETRNAFVDGYLLTGDIGYMDEDGYFYIVDRKKDLILSGGFNVYPLSIENAIHMHPDVAEALVIGVPDVYRGESAKAFVCLNNGAHPFTLEELQGFLADKLGRHEMPRFLEFRDELPRTSVGKASRKMLKDEERAKKQAEGA
ncbi:AMP-binding protein [Pseudooceanicola sp.]|uniref:AMP-binding protein n=1 Tax=Pseudooceanicola sp. TaxID=1914328 RepID=UPI00261AC0A2|nr:AMP-binding protein [Pseudooceanicola sp.]MDF1855620.1 AMP-binding protein [Pseudooceanicola sp.]